MNLAEIEALRSEMAVVVARLSEHCTGIQILASVPHDGGGTTAIKVGTGDWYARIGLCREFLTADDAETVGEAVGRAIDRHFDVVEDDEE
jgi:hypothetical protein